MLFGIEAHKGFVMLTGEVGTGKTTLIRTLIEQFPANVKYALIFHTLFSAKGLFQNLCKEFGLPVQPGSKTDHVLQLHEFLKANGRSNSINSPISNAVVIIDEAQNLNAEILEELRLLSNFESNNKKLLQVLLVGQPELLQTISRPDLRQLNQRISLRCRLRRFTLEEAMAYVVHRMRIAGNESGEEVFSPEALRLIHQRSRGVPRLINILCENALMMGYVRSESCISVKLINDIDFEDFFSEIDSGLSSESRRPDEAPSKQQRVVFQNDVAKEPHRSTPKQDEDYTHYSPYGYQDAVDSEHSIDNASTSDLSENHSEHEALNKTRDVKKPFIRNRDERTESLEDEDLRIIERLKEANKNHPDRHIPTKPVELPFDKEIDQSNDQNHADLFEEEVPQAAEKEGPASDQQLAGNGYLLDEEHSNTEQGPFDYNDDSSDPAGMEAFGTDSSSPSNRNRLLVGLFITLNLIMLILIGYKFLM